MTGKEYKARHILVKKKSEQRDHRQAEESPSLFEKLAKEKSQDPGSRTTAATSAGSIRIDPRSMVPEFGAAVAKLESHHGAGQAQFGYHVIQLEDSRPMQVSPFDQVKPGLTQQVQRQKVKKLVDDLKAGAQIDPRHPGARSRRGQEGSSPGRRSRQEVTRLAPNGKAASGPLFSSPIRARMMS